MDDQQTYLLNGLLARQFGLGRIIRFRQVTRGRQAATFELLTAQQNEYLAYLYPAAYPAEQLDFMAGAVNSLDDNRFTVVPWMKAKSGGFVGEGLQNGRLMVSLAVAGSALPPEQYTEHDVSQVGLRLAWMHRLLREQVPAPPEKVQLAIRLEREISGGDEHPVANVPAIGRETIGRLVGLMGLPVAVENGWVHGDVQPAALMHDADHQLRAMVDWGLLHWGSPLEDVVDAFLGLCVKADGTFDQLRGSVLLESYASLVPLKKVAWTPVVAAWCAQRIIDAVGGRRGVPGNFSGIVGSPEAVATAIASCR
ncbi:MAG: phosphotransferase [Phycisphaerae bacterium]